jgi:hypothetical protein
MARASHSARVKWPGKAGTSFIKRSSSETQIPRAVMMRVTMRGTRLRPRVSRGSAGSRCERPAAEAGWGRLRAERLSTSQKERQAASQPRAEAMEPTSVTGTRMESPRRRPTRVPAVMPMTATDGVEKTALTVAKRGAIVPRRA